MDNSSFHESSDDDNTAVLFINIIHNKKDASKTREGADEDHYLLREIFSGHRFKSYINLKAKKIKSVVEKFVTSNKHKRFENMFIIVGAHGGKEDTIFAHDGKKVKIAELLEIIKKTIHVRSKKITFIFQTCRGPLHGMKVVPYDDIPRSSIPDVTIVNASQPGCKSYRNKENGSYFFQAMAQVHSDMNGQIDNFHDFFVKISKKLQKVLTFGHVQVPELQTPLSGA